MALSLRDRFKLGRQIVERWQDKTWNAMSIHLLLRDFGLKEVDFEHWGGNEEIAERVSSATDNPLRETYRTTFDTALEEVDKVVRLARCKRRFIEAALRPPVHVARGNPQGIVGETSARLAAVGVHGFVAHDTMEPTKPW